MKTIKTAAFTLLTLLTLACANEKKPEPPQRVVEDVDAETGIISLRNYTIDDTITIGGNIYQYTCQFEHVDSMPVLINTQGLEYHECRVSIKINRQGKSIFDKTFYKNSLRDYVPADFLKTSTLVGVNYNYIKREADRSALYFILTVGDPDETSDNMAYPLELRVNTDGTYSIQKAENLETAPLRPGLNIDPGEDAI